MSSKIFSIEIFPPKITAGIESIYAPLKNLSKLDPEYISVTYSASGSAAGLTAEVCEYIQKNYGIDSVAHLTCAGNSREFIQDYLKKLKGMGIKKVLALRGDLTPEKQLTDFKYATDLIKEINEEGGFEIYAACYPEGHKESKGIKNDIKIMKMKRELGVNKFISQLFFDNNVFLDFFGECACENLHAKIAAGIMPVTNASQIVRMVQLSGAYIPDKMSKMIAKYEFDKEGLYRAGVDYAIEQARGILEYGNMFGIHLYAMNNADVATRFYDGIKDLLEKAEKPEINKNEY